ncbi:MAG: peptidoglycan-associated lipoprotein Pal [Gammaproteobacteria bacterium]|nr:peptidoglycan-associated lipoprotein Pal [Gammaproteobacteria bacterium]
MKKLIAVAALLGFLAACKSAPSVKSDAGADLADKSGASAIAQPDDSAGPVSAGEVGTSSESAIGLPVELANRTTIYFDFDSDSISADDQTLLAAHARFLGSRPGLSIRLEGHTDERGTREYNIGLGERRAQAVRRALGLQGVTDSRLSTVSYGEERPATAGEDESAYSRNRRVEIVYFVG